jgi:hypothetical protein
MQSNINVKNHNSLIVANLKERYLYIQVQTDLSTNLLTYCTRDVNHNLTTQRDVNKSGAHVSA